MEDIKIESKGLVLPQGAPVASLAEGEHTVTVEAICDDGLIRCVYPDGFVKHHQAETVEDLLGKVTSQLRGRYGVLDVQFTGVPKKIAAGQSITFQTVEV